MALSLDMDAGESINVGSAVITLIHKTGRKARLSIDADKTMPVSLNHTRAPTQSRGVKGK